MTPPAHVAPPARRWGEVAPTLPRTALAPVEVFSTEDTSAQLTWRDLGAGLVVAAAAGRKAELGSAADPGAGEVTGLLPGATNPIEVSVDGRPVASLQAVTQPRLPDTACCRFATISDLHLGARGFGALKPLRDHHPAVPYPLRCALAAVREAQEWGAELIVVKGDITERGRPEEWEQFDTLLAAIDVPVVAIPGNHDTVGTRRSIDAAAALGRRGLFEHGVQTVDLPGIRIVAADTTRPKRNFGRLTHRRDDLVAAVSVDGPVAVFLHHHLHDSVVPRIWPPGILRHEAVGVLDAMVAANPDLLVSSGHTHRNRVRHHGAALLTEVSSTSDFPGVWAGYVVHRAGIRQVQRRVASADCIAWTDRTHAAVGGLWGRWSPGSITDRNVTKFWSRPAADDSAENGARLHHVVS